MATSWATAVVSIGFYLPCLRCGTVRTQAKLTYAMLSIQDSVFALGHESQNPKVWY